MRVGLVTTSFPRFDGDYAGSFVADRARWLASEGHVVEVLAAGQATSAGEPEMPSANVRVWRVGTGAVGAPALFYAGGAPEALERGMGGTWLGAAAFSVALAGAVRAHAAGWDAIESHWLVPCALAALSGAPRLSLRAYAHSGDVALLERIPLGRALARQLARGATDLCFVTDALRRRFAALVGREVGRVEALPAPPLFRRRGATPDAALRDQLSLGSPTLLAVGRLVPIKGHDRLLQACALARAAGEDAGVDPEVVEVVILGDGPERPRLAAQAARLGVRLRLPGFVPRADVVRWLAAADLYVQPSVRLATGRGEGAPLATAEARSVGIPVIVDNDPKRLAEAIRAATRTRNPMVTAV